MNKLQQFMAITERDGDVKAAAPAASDFEALDNLRRLALAVQVPAPKQLELVLAELAEAS
jgi:hypothetical protein